LKKVVWTEKAVWAFKEHLAFLDQRSPLAAARVGKEILETIRSLTTMAEFFQLDEYRQNPAHNIRRFFRWNYTIV
jgi:plasmid stabilization system protein ParE